MLTLILPIWLNLSIIVLNYHLVVFLIGFFAILIVVDALLTIALDHIFSQNTNSLVGNLTFTCTLFCGEDMLYRIWCPPSLYIRIITNGICVSMHIEGVSSHRKKNK